MQVEFKIEPSASGKTFGIAIHKKGEEKPFMVMKNCKMASGQNGAFATGPSIKMDDGKWFNLLFMGREFGDYVTKLAQEAMPASKKGTVNDVDADQEIPF